MRYSKCLRITKCIVYFLLLFFYILFRQFKNDRTSDSIYKKYDNIKQRAKEKIDGIRRPKTGGGPPTAPLTQAEEALYQAMDTRPNIVGLVGGIDSDGNEKYHIYYR